MKKIFVFIANGFEDVETITPIDYLRRAGLEVITVGVTGKNVKSAHDITIVCDKTLNEVKGEDPFMIVLPGGLKNAENLANSPELSDFLKQVNNNGGIIGAICAAPPLILKPIGLLTNKKFTCYPGMDLNNKQEKFERVVHDGNIITACGPGATEEFALALIEAVLGKTAKINISNEIIAR